MKMNREDLRPWAKNRQSLRLWIAEGFTAESPSRSKLNPSLEDLEHAGDLLDESVEPVWASIRGHDDKAIAEQSVVLLQNLLANPCRQTSIRLYQIYFTTYFTHFGTWRSLAERMEECGLLKSDFIYEYFLFWAEEAPDEDSVETALYILARTQTKPPIALALQMANYPLMAVAAAAIIARQFNADEDALIGIARMHGYGARVHVLSMLRRVEKPENKRWLLTEGYDSGAEYHPCAFYAAIHGDLLAALKTPNCDAESIRDYASCLAIMCNAVGGAPDWMTIEDYKDAAEAFALLFAHIKRLDMAWPLLKELAEVLYFLEHQDPELCWPEATLQPLKQQCRAFFTPPLVMEAELHKYLWWECPPPTVENLKAGAIHELSAVLDAAKSRESDDELAAVINWATDYLCLQENADLRKQRMLELLEIRMQGVCSGGIAGVTDARLGSIYGQVLLQTIQALDVRQPIGPELSLLLAALDTDFPHLPKAAAEVLTRWPTEKIPEYARARVDQQLAN